MKVKYLINHFFFIIFSSIPKIDCSEKILIITHSHNRPDFIEIQAKTFQAFLLDEYEYIVFNDASNIENQIAIEETCKKLNIRCYRVPQTLHCAPRNSVSYRHMNGIRYALDKIGFDHNGIVVLVDSDAFLIKPFNISKYLNGFDIAGELQGKTYNNIEVRYLSPVIVFMNMKTLPNRKTINFDGERVEDVPCDNGGHTYYYLKDNPGVKSLFFGSLHVGVLKVTNNCKNCDNLQCRKCIENLVSYKFDESIIKFIHNCPDTNVEFFLDNTFLHYRGGSNWDYRTSDYHLAKTKALNTLIKTIIL